MPSPEQMPIACTLGAQDMGRRLAEIQRLSREHLRSHRVEGRTLRLAYAASAAAELTRIVDLERVCCAFLEFEIGASAAEVELSITAPEQHGAGARWLFAHFLPPTGQGAPQPETEASGCACCRRSPTIAGMRYLR